MTKPLSPAAQAVLDAFLNGKMEVNGYQIEPGSDEYSEQEKITELNILISCS